MGEISEGHPLRAFFEERVEEHFRAELGLRDAELQSYVANVLTEFCEAEQLCKIRDATGRPLHDVGELLLQSDPIYGPAPSFDRERQVRKHIGDYALFFTGMFPESLNKYRLRRHRLENFVDWMKAGKESYFIVSTFEFFEYAKVAPLFARLSCEFEACVYGLNRVRNDLLDRQYGIMKRAEDLIM